VSFFRLDWGRTASNALFSLLRRLALLGWSEWSEWSTCNEDNERTRVRQCTKRNPGPKECLGNEREVRICNLSGEPERQVAAASLAVHWIFIIMIGFGVFCAASAMLATKFLVERRINRLRTIQGSPHYGAYPNQYSSLPTKDYGENNKPKRQPSFNGGVAGSSKVVNGTLTKSNNILNQNTPKILKYQNDTDMSTLKRNSALNNMRLKQIEDDKDKY
jgi:semaphorin 5